MKVIIDKLSNNKGSYSSELPLTGELVATPEPGRSVYVLGGRCGGLVTSQVVEIMKTDIGWEVKTLNSLYRIEVLEN